MRGAEEYLETSPDRGWPKYGVRASAELGDGPSSGPNLTHSMIWRPKAAQTLRTLRFRDQREPRTYVHYDLAIQGLTHNMIWRTRGAQTLRTI